MVVLLLVFGGLLLLRFIAKISYLQVKKKKKKNHSVHGFFKGSSIYHIVFLLSV